MRLEDTKAKEKIFKETNYKRPILQEKGEWKKKGRQKGKTEMYNLLFGVRSIFEQWPHLFDHNLFEPYFPHL